MGKPRFGCHCEGDLLVELGSFAGAGVVRHKCGRRSQRMRKFMGNFKRNHEQMIRLPSSAVTERGRPTRPVSLSRRRAPQRHGVWFQKKLCSVRTRSRETDDLLSRHHLQRSYKTWSQWLASSPGGCLSCPILLQTARRVKNEVLCNFIEANGL